MKQDEILSILRQQRRCFDSGATLPVKNRIAALKRLRQCLISNEKRIAAALWVDLGKSPEECYLCEIGMVISELSYLISHTKRFAKEKTVVSPLAQFPCRSYQKPTPYGVTLIMSPWNYPLLLTLGPLADALAAGNTAIVKPSAYAPATGRLLAELLGAIFPKEYVAVVTGGREENAFLLEQKFDYIFFTGSKNVGKLVLEKAARHLTPVTLELGGKSPCIIDKSADLKTAARRIVFGKFLNCGQTCVAPDYLLCHSSVKTEFLTYLTAEIQRQYGTDYRRNKTYGKIINPKHFHRITQLIDANKVICGGRWDEESLKVEPTVMDNVLWEDPVMQEEIFGPVLPVLTFEETDEVIRRIRERDKPLALYIFAQDQKVIRRFTSECQFGGGCVNDCVIHLATSRMGFGGVGESGMGDYHGKAGFDTFTHYKSIVDKKTWLDLPMRYQPYRSVYQKLIRLFLR